MSWFEELKSYTLMSRSLPGPASAYDARFEAEQQPFGVPERVSADASDALGAIVSKYALAHLRLTGAEDEEDLLPCDYFTPPVRFSVRTLKPRFSDDPRFIPSEWDDIMVDPEDVGLYRSNDEGIVESIADDLDTSYLREE